MSGAVKCIYLFKKTFILRAYNFHRSSASCMSISCCLYAAGVLITPDPQYAHRRIRPSDQRCPNLLLERWRPAEFSFNNTCLEVSIVSLKTLISFSLIRVGVKLGQFEPHLTFKLLETRVKLFISYSNFVTFSWMCMQTFDTFWKDCVNCVTDQTDPLLVFM